MNAFKTVNLTFVEEERMRGVRSVRSRGERGQEEAATMNWSIKWEGNAEQEMCIKRKIKLDNEKEGGAATKVEIAEGC